MPFDGASLTKTQRVLLDAAKEVRKGWCQFALARDGNVCVLGALYVADGADRTTESIVSRDPSDAGRAAYTQLTKHVGYITIFNNAPKRTSEEVATALEAAAFMRDS